MEYMEYIYSCKYDLTLQSYIDNIKVIEILPADEINPCLKRSLVLDHLIKH